MADPYIGEIRMFAGNYAPMGWALCDGQTMPIQQYTALFAILGTTYGGNGQTTFGLPDLRGRIPMHMGTGPGLTPRPIGQSSGAEKITLTANQMPAHNHLVNADGQQGTVDNPEGVVPAAGVDPATTNPVFLYGTAMNKTMSPQMISQAGGNQPHDNVQPFLCVNFIIALEGEFPPRN